jgi:hypothetical protein
VILVSAALVAWAAWLLAAPSPDRRLARLLGGRQAVPRGDGRGGIPVLLSAVVAGLVDTHAAAISVATLVASGKVVPQDAVLPILAALTSNTLSKIAMAAIGGGWAFALRVVPGLVLVALAAWVGTFAAWLWT